MKPVVGVDVAKGSSVVQALLGRNEPYRKTENIQDGEIGFERLGELVTELKVITVLTL